MAKRKITIEDLRRFKFVSDPQVSLDGEKVAFVLSTINLEENGLIEGSKEEGYRKTEKGEVWHDILKRHSDLVGVLTQELSGDRRKSLD